MKCSLREMIDSDIEKIVDYFLDADPEFLKSMGADKTKLPNRSDWIEKLKLEFKKPIKQKDFYYMIWLLDGQPVGHSNINEINYGKSAKMHLHIWHSENRKNGYGLDFLKQTMPFYFRNFKLKKLICEPYSQNISPNKTLIKVGFEFVKSYKTTPGWINYHQIVNRYEMTKERFEQVIKVNSIQKQMNK